MDTRNQESGVYSVDLDKYVPRISEHLPNFLNEDDPLEAAEKIIGWTIHYRSGDGTDDYLWRTGGVLSISKESNTNVVIQLEPAPSDSEPLAPQHVLLDLHNFGDGSEDGQCWFRLEDSADARRRALREASAARARFRERSGRKYRNEKPCGQCGFRAVMRQILAMRGHHLDNNEEAVTLQHVVEARQLIGQGLVDHAQEIAPRVRGALPSTGRTSFFSFPSTLF